MKARIYEIAIATIVLESMTFGQGSLVFDQQSASSGFASGGARIIEQQPLGQSFTPSLSAIGFVAFQFGDFEGNQGATVYVNLRENSITGNVLATTAPVFMNNGFNGNAFFFFPGNVPVNAGTTYYLQPAHLSGDDTGVMGDLYNYFGGSLFAGGVATTTPGLDFWFREGIVVPEPSLTWLGILGAGLLFGCTRRGVRQRAR